jgi:hypothetical protein
MGHSEKLSLAAKFREVAKLAAVLVAAAYGVGVVISNGYLASLGDNGLQPAPPPSNPLGPMVSSG